MALFFRQLFAELEKLFGRKRSYMGFGAFVAVELVILLLCQLPKVQRSFHQLIENTGNGFEEYFSGVTLAFMVLSWTSFLLASLYLSLVAGDVVSKEVEEGTMRMTLCRPVARLRLLIIKYIACVIYTFALMIFIGLTALAMGLARRGYGGLFVYDPFESIYALFEKGPGLVRYLSCLPFLGLSFLTVTSLGFALSCFNLKPAAATISSLSYILVDFIFKGIPYFSSIKIWFLTSHMSAWTGLFRSPVPWPKMIEDYAYLGGINLTLVVIAMAHFQQRDFKS